LAYPTGFTEEQLIKAIDKGKYKGGPTGRFWTIDPIDGTLGFLRGEQYAVCLALIENGEVLLGVLGCPNYPLNFSDPSAAKGALFVSVKGHGATMRSFDEPVERLIFTQKLSDSTQANFCESVEASHSSQGEAAEVARILGITAPPLRMDSQCKYAAIARGDATIYLRLSRAGYEEKIWDHAAGWLLVKEAGGKVTDILGNELDFTKGTTLKNNRGVVATNGRLHPAVIKAIDDVIHCPPKVYRLSIKKETTRAEAIKEAIVSLGIHPSFISVEEIKSK